MASDDDRLKDIRENWDEDERAFKDIRKAGDDDISCLTGGIWSVEDPDSVAQRNEAQRPMIQTDELNQYCNQGINDLRANKRGIKVTPMGNGANDQTARWRQGKIRDIEYRSNSHQAYTTMGENAFQRGFGWMKLTKKYVTDAVPDRQPLDPSIFHQELLIEAIPDPNRVTPDAYSVKSDGKDLRRIWERTTLSHAEFKRTYPKATIRDFGEDAMRIAPHWIHGTTVDVAACWEKTFSKTRTVLAIKPANDQLPPDVLWADDPRAKGIDSDLIVNKREIDQFTVVQYITNGLEILKRIPWDGQSIPFVPCYGKVMYVTAGGQTKRVLLSLIRLARSPQMLMNYLSSAEAELVGSVTKFPYFFYDGSLTPEALALLARSTREPVAAIPVKPSVTGMPAGQPPPYPQRNPWDISAVQSLELLREAARRAVQSAVGQTGLPTQAQRRNEKSGVALKQIEDSAARGSFHFVDHYDEAITRMGELINENIASTYDTARTTSIRQPNDEVAQVRINDPAQRYTSKLEPSDDPNQSHIDTSAGNHDVTISVGPRQESERDAASEFADTIVQSKVVELVGPQKGPKLIASAIRLKNLGPIGDEMADIIDPKDQNDPQHAAQMAQHLQQENQQLKGALQEAAMEKHAKLLELQSREKIAGMEIASKEKISDADRQAAAADREVKITVAELSAKVKDLQLFMEERARLGVQAHDAEQAGLDRQHEIVQAEVEHQQAKDAAAQAHDHQLEQGDQAQAGALQQQQQAADLAPPPTNGAGA